MRGRARVFLSTVRTSWILVSFPAPTGYMAPRKGTPFTICTLCTKASSAVGLHSATTNLPETHETDSRQSSSREQPEKQAKDPSRSRRQVLSAFPFLCAPAMDHFHTACRILSLQKPPRTNQVGPERPTSDCRFLPLCTREQTHAVQLYSGRFGAVLR